RLAEALRVEHAPRYRGGRRRVVVVVGGGGGGEDAAAADGARGVRQQPGVDAGHVERVAARREEAELVVAGELAQAHGAVERVVLAEPGADDGAVDEDGERVDEGLVDAGVVEVEQLLELALERRRAAHADAAAAVAHAPPPPPRPAHPEQVLDQQVEQAEEEEDDGEDGDDEEDA
ncbi:Os06g0187350, partial [Oryza sativa Japonica Group]